ncbi:leucine rich adaptor protein 1-like [Pseudoliparis swirei]|uniref:leucine rich adaptor protein 1-like n=1 Tax=Pseudoliparis swirei TaxID=2059687 RepID=UPI0024BE451F|nr:leucine rich adaptor protein 1-like [Pseudoliparis swirei]
MAEDILNDSFLDLREVENKVGRKTPESLLIWMRDSADCEDGWRSDVVDRADRSSAFSGSFSDRISSLKQEMRSLRSADVKILRQLLAVHEGIEAMRWLMEEPEASVSHSSSSTGSLSSLVAVEEHGLSVSPCRERLTQDLTENSGDEASDHQPHAHDDELNHKSYFDMRIPEFTEERPPSPSIFKLEVSHSTHGSRGPSSSGPANCLGRAKSQKSQPQDSDVAPSRFIKDDVGTIRRALLRSSRSRRNMNDIFSLTKHSEEIQTKHQHNTMEEEENPPNRDTTLLGYNAPWCWVESQDDHTYL